jgi:hypothetical protein
MKSKILISSIIVAVILSIFAIPAFAANIVEIYRPDGNEVVTKELFSISGACTYEDTTIEFYYKNKNSDEFVPLETTEGYSSFKVGSSKLFAKEVNLKYKGDNVIRIKSYTKSSKPQYNTFTITYSEETKKGNWLTDSISNVGDSICDWLGIK